MSRLDLLGMNSASKLEWGLSVCNAGTEDFMRFGLGNTCAWNSSMLVTWTAGSGNDSCWRAGELLRERLFGTVPGQREAARARMSTEDAPACTGEDAVEEDLRTLWIDRDDPGQRFKEWKKVCSERSEERQADIPVEGPPSCFTACKQAPRRKLQVVDAPVDEGARCKR